MYESNESLSVRWTSTLQWIHRPLFVFFFFFLSRRKREGEWLGGGAGLVNRKRRMILWRISFLKGCVRKKWIERSRQDHYWYSIEILNQNREYVKEKKYSQGRIHNHKMRLLGAAHLIEGCHEVLIAQNREFRRFWQTWDGRTDERTNGPTDTPLYRVAKPHLKRESSWNKLVISQPAWTVSWLMTGKELDIEWSRMI